MPEFNDYYPDIFYAIHKLSFKNKIKLLKEAKELCFRWWEDILDCNISFQRQKIEMSFEEALSKCDKNTHFVFIHRRGYVSWRERNELMDGWRFEVGYRTMTGPVDYFLWIEIDEDKIDGFIQKYNLKLL
jgi:hypothetical protein